MPQINIYTKEQVDALVGGGGININEYTTTTSLINAMKLANFGDVLTFANLGSSVFSSIAYGNFIKVYESGDNTGSTWSGNCIGSFNGGSDPIIVSTLRLSYNDNTLTLTYYKPNELNNSYTYTISSSSEYLVQVRLITYS